MTTTKKFGRITLTIDPNDDATPAMVYLGRSASATWDCAVDTGTVTSHRDSSDVQLTQAELDWLDKQSDAVQSAFEIARP